MIWSIYIVVFSGVLSFSNAIFMNACDSRLETMIANMQKQAKDFNFNCSTDGIRCSEFSCDVTATGNEYAQITIVGSWICNKQKPAFKIKLLSNKTKTSLTEIFSNEKPTKKMTLLYSTQNHPVLFQVVPVIKFNEQGKDYTTNFTLQLTIKLNNGTNDFTDKISTSENIDIRCNCSNINSLQSQIASNFSAVKDVSCWGYNPSCASFYCAGLVEKPQQIHFSFNGAAYCSNDIPVYGLNISMHLVDMVFKHKSQHVFLEGNDADSVLTFDLKTPLILTLTFGGKFKNGTKKDTITLSSNTTVDLKSGSAANNLHITKTITIDFQKLGCYPKQTTTDTTASSTPTLTPSPTLVPIEKPTQTPTITTTETAMLATTSITAPSTSITTITTTTTTTTIMPTPSASKEVTPTSSASKEVIPTKKTHAKHASHPAKAVLIVLAVLIILSVILVGVYLKKRRRLSNQPAYYNDIALNDPLRYEMDDDHQDDDDELPLFS